MLRMTILAVAAVALTGCYNDGFTYSDSHSFPVQRGVTFTSTIQDDSLFGTSRQVLSARNGNTVPMCASLEYQAPVLIPAGQSRVVAEMSRNRNGYRTIVDPVNPNGTCN